jgi:hypothetical protein
MNASLKAAGSSLGKSIGTLISKNGAAKPSVILNDQKIGLGTAKEHIWWAKCTHEIRYSTTGAAQSDRKTVVLEATRFSYLWTAADALFSRPGIHTLIGTAHAKDELSNFRALFTYAGVPAASIASKRQALLDILMTEVTLQEPAPGVGRSTLSVWEMIYFKYTSTPQKKRGIGRYMAQCVLQGTPFAPDLPFLIYASRNWHFHGVLVTSSLRGPPGRPLHYYRTLNTALAEFFELFAAKVSALV